jgi:hypothetical protein
MKAIILRLDAVHKNATVPLHHFPIQPYSTQVAQ